MQEHPCRCPLSGVCTRDRGPFREIRREKHQILYLEGDLIDRVYLIQTGSVSLHRMQGESRGLGRTHAIRKQHSFLGAEALVQSRYIDSARAEQPLRLCAIEREHFIEWVGPLKTSAALVLASTLQTQQSQPVQKASPDGSAVQRTAYWLIHGELEQRDGHTPRRLIADLLGMRPETLSRALHELHGRGLIDVSARQIQVLDPEALEDLLPS